MRQFTCWFFTAAMILFMGIGCTKQVTQKVVVPPCHCGCMETGQCKCQNCCKRTADPTWKE